MTITQDRPVDVIDQPADTALDDAPDAEAADTEDRPGELAYADARHLVIAKNAARKDDAEEFQLDAAFLSDILARGVQDPITVRRDGRGRRHLPPPQIHVVMAVLGPYPPSRHAAVQAVISANPR